VGVELEWFKTKHDLRRHSSPPESWFDSHDELLLEDFFEVAERTAVGKILDY
jgi:hypothetical protein